MNALFKSETKRWIAACFSILYAVLLICNIDFRWPAGQPMDTAFFRYIVNTLIVYLVPLITPIFVPVFLLTLHKEYRFQKWLLPIGFGVYLFFNILLVCESLPNMPFSSAKPAEIVMILCSYLLLIPMALMFVGSLFRCKYVKLLKYGALGYFVLCIALLVAEFIAVGGFAYLQSVPQGVAAINILALAQHLARVLFYVGIFIVTTG